MRSITDAFLAKVESGELRGSYCLRLSRQDGADLCLTNCDVDIVFQLQTFHSSPGVTIGNIKSGADLNPDDFEVEIAFDETYAKREDFVAERYNDSFFDLYFVDRTDLENFIIIQSGVLGEVKLSDKKVTVSLLSHIERLGYDVGNEITPKCRYILGDRQCGVNLQSYMACGAVKAVTSNSEFTAYIQAIPYYNTQTSSWVTTQWQSMWTDDAKKWFTYGSVFFALTPVCQRVGELLATQYGGALNTTMKNQGIKRLVRKYNYVSSTPTFILSRSMPYPILPGDVFYVVPGCQKSTDYCDTIFDNLIRFGAEPDLPQKDRVLSQAHGVSS